MVTDTWQSSKTHFLTFNFDGAKTILMTILVQNINTTFYCHLKAAWNNTSISSGNVINAHKHHNNTISEYSPVTSP